MKLFRVIGVAISLFGVAIFILAIRGIMPLTNASAGIGAFGPIHFFELLFGAALVFIGLCLVIFGGPSKKLP